MSGCVEKASEFFRLSLLPELIGKFYSRPAVTTFSGKTSELPGLSKPNTEIESTTTYRRKPESGNKLACDNKSCPIEWFHFECLQLSAAPRTKSLYCPKCRKLKRKIKMKALKCKSLGAYCISCVLCQCACIVRVRGSVRNYTHAHYL